MLPYGIEDGTKIQWISDEDTVERWYVIKKGVLYRTVPPNAPSRAMGHKEDPNPYKKAWNSVEDEESYILDAVKNGTLFVPTPAELAKRHRSTERYWRNRADEVVGSELALDEAEFHGRIAKNMEDLEDRFNKVSRPKELRFFVKTN